MNQLAENESEVALQDLDNLPVSKIAEMFEDAIKDIYLKVSEAAFLLLALEKRPEAAEIVQKLRRKPIVGAIRSVGVGTLIKEAFLDYYGRPDVLRAMTALPAEKQRELVEARAVPMYDRLGGKDTHIMVPLEKITPQELAIVFDTKEHCVRTPEMQAQLLAHRRIKERIRRPRFGYDELSGTVTCSDMTPAQVVAEMRKRGLL